MRLAAAPNSVGLQDGIMISAWSLLDVLLHILISEFSEFRYSHAVYNTLFPERRKWCWVPGT
jgi:hypothetical protein